MESFLRLYQLIVITPLWQKKPLKNIHQTSFFFIWRLIPLDTWSATVPVVPSNLPSLSNLASQHPAGPTPQLSPDQVDQPLSPTDHVEQIDNPKPSTVNAEPARTPQCLAPADETGQYGGFLASCTLYETSLEQNQPCPVPFSSFQPMGGEPILVETTGAEPPRPQMFPDYSSGPIGPERFDFSEEVAEDCTEDGTGLADSQQQYGKQQNYRVFNAEVSSGAPVKGLLKVTMEIFIFFTNY